MVFYTDRFIPSDAAGCARGPIVFIRPQYKDDKGLLAHENNHVKQWLRTFGLHSWLYILSKSYRLASEVECYRIQASFYEDDRRPLFARYIARSYGLDISEQEALKLLTAG
jgi:hypothetical protein